MNEWFIHTGGIAVGPFSDRDMAAMIREGKVDRNMPIRLGRGGSWRPGGEYPEFFPPQILKQVDESVPVASPAAVPDEPVAMPLAVMLDSRQPGEYRFACPGCNQRYSGGRDFDGLTVTCVDCGTEFRVKLPPPAAANAAAGDFSDRGERVEFPGKTPAVEMVRSNMDFAPEIPAGDIICPHCWQSFGLESLLYISVHPALVGDPVLGEFEQKRFAPSVFNPLGQPLDARGMVATDMACPRCHLRLPSTLIDLRSFIVSIAGAPSSGKSYYLTVLVHLLRELLPERFGLSFIDVDPLLNATLESYERAIFMASDPGAVAMLPKTQQTGSEFSDPVLLSGVPTDLPKPFVFAMTGTDESRGRNLIFYDNAGEHFQPGADVTVNPATCHLACSNGIVFLFDPTNDATMRSVCDSEDPQVGEVVKISDQTMLLSEMVNRIRRHRNQTALEKCPIPLIVAVGKYDVWKKAFERSEQLHQVCRDTPDGEGWALDVGYLCDISFSLRELMKRFVPGLVNAAEGFFESVYFLPVSSFGCFSRRTPSGGLGIVPAEMKPFWVEVPMLLLLALSGLIPTAPDAGDGEKVTVRQDGRSFSFRHPVRGITERMPLNYLGSTLEIGGRRYTLPPRSGMSRSAATDDPWK